MNQEFVYRVVDSKGKPIKTRMSGSPPGSITYTERTYTTAAAASGVATRKNNELPHDEYRVQVSRVEWVEFDLITRKAV